MTRVRLLAVRSARGLDLPCQDRGGRLFGVPALQATDVDELNLLVELDAVEVRIGNAVRCYPVVHHISHYDLAPETNARTSDAGATASAPARAEPPRFKRR